MGVISNFEPLFGICRTSCATSLPPRRRGPCKLFEAHGLTADGLFPHKPLQEQARTYDISPGDDTFRSAHNGRRIH